LQMLYIYSSRGTTYEFFQPQISRSDLVALLVDFFLPFKFQSWISRPAFRMKISANV
jgi:hypothetical protein